MIDLKKYENEIEVKNSGSMPTVLFLCGFLVVILMVVIMVGIATNEPIGFMEISFFVVFMVVLVIREYIDSKKSLTLNEDGVTFKAAFKSAYISWADVKDCGISYCFRSKTSVYYCLYFSKENQNEKNRYSKKLKGKMIKFVFEANDYSTIRDNIIPYCAEKTANAPFICKEK